MRKTAEDELGSMTGIEYVQSMLKGGDVELIGINSTTIKTKGPDATVTFKPNAEGWIKFYAWLNECIVAYRQKCEAKIPVQIGED